jgi:hypothetical protein
MRYCTICLLCLETFFLNSWPILTFSDSVESFDQDRTINAENVMFACWLRSYEQSKFGVSVFNFRKE